MVVRAGQAVVVTPFTLGGAMARFYGLPMRVAGVCAANVPDGQAMWETSNSVQSGTNMVYHAAGWLEGGLIASPEKFIMDCEVIQMIQRYMDPQIVATTPDGIAIDAIREVRLNEHHFGIEHTQDRYENAFYARIVSDGRNFEAWDDGGAQWAAVRQQIFENFRKELNLRETYLRAVACVWGLPHIPCGDNARKQNEKRI